MVSSHRQLSSAMGFHTVDPPLFAKRLSSLLHAPNNSITQRIISFRSYAQAHRSRATLRRGRGILHELIHKDCTSSSTTRSSSSSSQANANTPKNLVMASSTYAGSTTSKHSTQLYISPTTRTTRTHRRCAAPPGKCYSLYNTDGQR
jgi:hypothetical protein